MSETTNNFQSDFMPACAIQNLAARAQLNRRIREFFDGLGFIEVETPLLSHDIVIDRHLHPISVSKSEVIETNLYEPSSLASCQSSSGLNDRLWLQTSPEFAMKRLLVGGMTAIYQICKAFRQGEVGRQHNPEFTMLEWYRVGDGYQEAMDLLDQFVQSILGRPPADRMSYRDAFLKWAKLDPLAADDVELATVAGVQWESGMAEEPGRRDEWLNVILATQVEPNLGGGVPLILYDYPASQAALAKVRKDRPPVAERFELYVDGVEIANGYHELLDAEELCERNRKANALRIQDGHTTLPEDSRLLAAMRRGLPSCSGTALGIDRLAMIELGVESMDEVIPFPLSRA